MMCPVCFYKELPYPPNNYNICPCCGTEFGDDDADLTHEELQRVWIDGGLRWFYGNPPQNWNGWNQLLKAKQIQNFPRYSISTSADAVVTRVALRAPREPSFEVTYA